MSTFGDGDYGSGTFGSLAGTSTGFGTGTGPAGAGAVKEASVLYDVQAFKVYPFTSSDSTGGPPPVYGTGVACQGIAAVTLTPTIVTGTFKANGGRIQARYARIESASLSATYGRLGLDSLAVMTNTTVSDVGFGTDEVVEWDYDIVTTLPYFRAEFQIIDTDNGVASATVVLWKCQLKTATFVDSKTNAFGQPQVAMDAVPLLSNGRVMSIRYYAVQTALD